MPIVGGHAVGSQHLGMAKASIVIDTSDLERTKAFAEMVGKSVADSLGKIDKGAKVAQSGLQTLSKGVTSLRGELLSIGAAGGLITKFGLDAALSVRNYGVAFNQFTGSQKESSKLMSDLTKKADEFGLEVEGVWQLGRSLLPVLKGNTAELDKWVTRAAMLRSVFPAAQKGAETRAISELMAGQTMSIQRLFNVSPSVIAEAKAQFTDIGDQMDYILAKMGATEAGARGMANGFIAVQNELKLAAAAGFGPLFQAMQPVLRSFTTFIQSLRDTSPGVLTFGASVAAIATVGAPSLLLLNQLVIAAEKLKMMGVLGGLGKLGALGIGGAVGAQAGTLAVNAVGRATGNQGQANATVGSILENGKAEIFRIVLYVFQTITTINNQMATGVRNFLNGIASMVEGMAGYIRAIAQMIPEGLGVSLNNTADAVSGAADKIRAAGDRVVADRQAANAAGQANMDAFRRLLAPGGDSGDPANGPGYGAGADADPTIALKTDFYQSVQKIESAANADRLAATQQYESQRSETIRGYEQGIAREAEDFGISRARAAAQLADTIAQIGIDSARQAAKWAEDLAESIADMQADSGKRVAEAQETTSKRLNEINEEYAKNRERAARDHNDTLLEAAANLDARAVFNEQKNFARSSADAADAHNKAISDQNEQLADRTSKEAESLAERVKNEQDANAERLADTREADALRIQQAKDSLADQQKIEDENRALTLARQAADHQAQLAQMATAQGERLAQIATHAKEERAALDEEFQKALDKTGVNNAKWLEQQAKLKQQALDYFDAFWKHIINSFNAANQYALQSRTEAGAGADRQTPDPIYPGFASGGLVRNTGLAMVHANEFVLSRSMVERMGGHRGVQQMQMTGGGRGGVNVGDISFSIITHPGMDAHAVAKVVRGELMDILESAA